MLTHLLHRRDEVVDKTRDPERPRPCTMHRVRAVPFREHFERDTEDTCVCSFVSLRAIAGSDGRKTHPFWVLSSCPLHQA